MKKTIALMATLAIGAGAAGVGAAASNNLVGSDTFEDFMLEMLKPANCSAAAGNITYSGPGSTQGQNAMRDRQQGWSPMSRKLNNCTSATTKSANQVTASDAIVVTVSTSMCGAAPEISGAGDTFTVNNCPATLNGCNGNNYTIPHWREVLRVLYTGIHSGTTACTQGTNNCTGGAVCLKSNGLPAATGESGTCSVKDCNSVVRRGLASSIDNVLKGTCPTGNCPNGLKRLVRRGDVSGTTDVFLGFIGSPTVSNRPFCNGTDYQDRDPIRVPCDPLDDICSNRDTSGDSTNGLLLALHASKLTVDEHYPTKPCNKFGVFRRAQADVKNTAADPGFCVNNPAVPCTLTSECVAAGVGGACKTDFCPDNKPASGGLCKVPVRTQAGLPNNEAFDCLNSDDNRGPAQALTESGRVYNNYLYTEAGLLRSDDATPPRKMTGVKLRTRSSLGRCSGTQGARPCLTNADCSAPNTCVLKNSCRELNATDQIGCFTADDQCTVGWAGNGSDFKFANNVGAIVEGFIPGPAGGYPLARLVYTNTYVGFTKADWQAANIPGNLDAEAALLKCMSTEATADSVALTAGMFPAPDAEFGACSNVTAGSTQCSPTSACLENSKVQCADGIDNDADGNVDCADAKCARFCP